MKFERMVSVLMILGLFLCDNAFAAASVPRPYHPRPQFARLADYLNLNGAWSFTFDFDRTGMERGYHESYGFDREINVPFCPESELSGVKHDGFIEAMWYHRKILVPAKWQNKRILLHFGAVDYECEVFINGRSVGTHWGGCSSFSFDISSFIQLNQIHDLVVRVHDDTRSQTQTTGNQSQSFTSKGTSYTRTTGIWQTVWLEAVHPLGLESCRIVPDLDNQQFIFVPHFRAMKQGYQFSVRISEDGKNEVAKRTAVAGNGLSLAVPLEEPKIWSQEYPFLYRVYLEVLDDRGTVIDSVYSYAGLRKVHVEGNRIFLNNKPLYLRLVMDQGYYPQGLRTAPSSTAFERDIKLAKKAGFNGARLHGKVFEEQYHFYADKLGFLTFCESGAGADRMDNTGFARQFMCEWKKQVVRDRNHPSIIGWIPFDETLSHDLDIEQHDRLVRDVYDLTHELDPTRPVNDVSGGHSVKTDLWSVHVFNKTPEELALTIMPNTEAAVFMSDPNRAAAYTGQPYWVSAYGGITWVDGTPWSEHSWGFTIANTQDEFYRILNEATSTILALEHVSGFCYRQLTDIEQEQNGIYNYDRSEKYDISKVYDIIRKPTGR